MPWRRLCGTSIHAFPALLLVPSLLIEPFLERGEIIKDGGGIHLPLAADGFQRVRPGMALAHAQHFIQALTGSFVFVDGAAMQRALNSRRLAQRAMKLELKNTGQEITDVRGVGSHVAFSARIKAG